MVKSPRIIGEFDNQNQKEKVPRKKSVLASILTVIAIVFILFGTCGINLGLANKLPDSLGTPLMLFWILLIVILAKLGSMDTKKSRIALLILCIIVLIVLDLLQFIQ